MQQNSICAVVVTYHPGPGFANNLSLLAEQVGHVIVVDNASTPQSCAVIEEVCRRLGATLLSNSSNLGIATALNQGCLAATERGFEWIATFDQDSTITPNFIANLFAVGCGSDRIGIVAPQYVDRESGSILPQPVTSEQDLIVAMTSGSLLRTSAYVEAGPFRDDFVIDYVDTEYCLRLRSRGFRIAKAPGAHLLHSLGRTRYHRLLGRQVGVTHHSAVRRYYITRNRLIVLRLFPRERTWLRWESKAFVSEVIKIVLFEEHKFEKLVSLYRGILDFALGRLGQRVAL